MTHKLCWLKKMIYVLSLLMSLLILPGFAAEQSSNVITTTNNRLAVTPSKFTIGAGKEYTFQTTGKIGNLNWSAIKGNLAITPSTVNLNPEEEQLFTVNNSLDEIKWSAEAGTIVPKTNTQAEYTAPKSSGTYKIIGTDYKTGRTIEATVTVARKLTVIPTEAQIGTTRTQTFSVAGGEEPYIWKVIGKGSLDCEISNTVEYTAAKSIGEDRLVVMDNRGVSAEVNITVNGTLDTRESIQVTPDVRCMKRGETKSFTVSGVSPYTARIIDGNGTLSPDISDDGRFTYTAGNIADKDILIEFSDNSGQTVQAHAYVERKLRLTSGILYVDKGTSTKLIQKLVLVLMNHQIVMVNLL
jgi:hypothetical protein